MKPPHRELIFNLLKDRQIHFSAEFRERLGLLEYRQPIDQLRKRGCVIQSVEHEGRPAWIMRSWVWEPKPNLKKDLFAA